jgi:glycosyltransferase involved in cell wall biosynthesis
MIIWLLNVGENMPIDGNNPRLLRCGILANHLLERGHKIIWWTSTFDHYNRIQRFKSDRDINISEMYKIKFLHGTGYKKNISLMRLLDHYILGVKFRKYSKLETKPDIIICSFPIISFSEKAVRYGKEHSIPVVIDARDMWPDIFIDKSPYYFRFISKIFLRILFNKTKYIFKGATAITGMTNEFVDWGIKKADRERTNIDIAFPFGYIKSNEILTISERLKVFEEFNLNIDRQIVIVIAYIGSIINIDLLMACAQKLTEKKLQIDIVVCGVGDKFELLKMKSQNLTNLKLLGWCDKNQISGLLQISKFGFLPYYDRVDFRNSIPNKIPEYMSAGLPVFTSVTGIVAGILRDNNCGYYIANEDDFFKIVLKLTQNVDLYNSLSKNSTNYFQNTFDSKKVYSEMSQYLENII